MTDLQLVIKHLLKPLYAALLFTLYVFYVNFFGVVSFMSLNMFLIPLITLILFIWGVIVTLKAAFTRGVNLRMTKIGVGLIIAAYPFVLFSLQRDINELGIKRKVKKFDKQLTVMCEKIIKDMPENMYFPIHNYKEFDIWAFGARPTRQAGYLQNGVVYLDFNGSPDDGSGIIYNPRNSKIRFRETCCYHITGPWYRFNVYYE